MIKALLKILALVGAVMAVLTCISLFDDNSDSQYVDIYGDDDSISF